MTDQEIQKLATAIATAFAQINKASESGCSGGGYVPKPPLHPPLPPHHMVGKFMDKNWWKKAGKKIGNFVLENAPSIVISALIGKATSGGGGAKSGGGSFSGGSLPVPTTGAVYHPTGHIPMGAPVGAPVVYHPVAAPVAPAVEPYRPVDVPFGLSSFLMGAILLPAISAALDDEEDEQPQPQQHTL